MKMQPWIILDRVILFNPWPTCSDSPVRASLGVLLRDQNAAGFSIRAALPLRQAFAGKILDVSKQVIELAPKGIRTEFEENRHIGGYGLTVVKNACFLPEGDIVLVNITDEYLNRTLLASPRLRELWDAGYNSTCGWCQKTGSRLSQEPPQGARWLRGNTSHMIPYLGNVFHNFGERIWPHLASHQSPLRETAMQPINHFFLHRFNTWIQQAEEGNHERETFMLQFRVLAELSPGSDFVVIDRHPVCFERLTLDCSTCDRMSDLLGKEVVNAAIISYRQAAFRFFSIPEPAVSLPPRPLRVVFYGRSDTRRRRVTNTEEILQHLRAWRNPPLDILFVDGLLRQGRYNQTMAETISLFAQTDVFITVHGANTWAAMFLPRGAAVLEIYGPCGPSSWIQGVARALDLKHDTGSNPWRDRVASPFAGNTTECEGFYQTPDFLLDVRKLDDALRKFALPAGSSDRIPLHWLYDWSKQSYINNPVAS